MILSKCTFGLWSVFLFLFVVIIDPGLGLHVAYARSLSDTPSRLGLGLDQGSTITEEDGYKLLKSDKQVHATSSTAVTLVDDTLSKLFPPNYLLVGPDQGVGLGPQGSEKYARGDSGLRRSAVENVSSFKTDNSTIPDILRSPNNNTPTRPTPHPESTGTLNVPSEGGVVQGQKISSPEIISTPSKSEVPDTNASTNKTEVLNGTKKYIEVGLDLSTRPITREGVPSYASVDSKLGSVKQDSNYSTVDARNRKRVGQGLGEISDGLVSSQKSTSEESIIEHISKISPRKGVNLTDSDSSDTISSQSEVPVTEHISKISPRKGVNLTDQFDSSDTISSQINIGTLSSSNSNTNTSHELKNVSNVLSFNKPDALPNNGTNLTENGTKSTAFPKTITGSSTLVNTDTVTPKITSLKEVENLKNTSSSSNMTSALNLTDPSGIIASYPPLRKRKKPEKTTDTNPLDEGRHNISTERSSSGHDYVIPIVVTILTVPMLIVLALFLYKKGSECWERRHYRRMDFLIDGMYND